MTSTTTMEDLQPWIRERIKSVQAGDRAAFGEIIERLHLVICRCVALFGAPFHEVDELAQRTCLEALAKIDDYDPERPFIPWIRGIARHIVLRYYERRRLDASQREDRVRYFLARAADREDGPMTDGRYDIDYLRQCLDQLPTDARRLVGDHYFNQLDSLAIAERDGRTIEAVRMALSRARAALRTCIEHRLKGEGATHA